MKNIKLPVSKSNILFAIAFTFQLASFGQTTLTTRQLVTWAGNHSNTSIKQPSLVSSIKLLSFRYIGETDGKYAFECNISNIENVKSIILEGNNGERYTAITSIDNLAGRVGTAIVTLNAPSLSDLDYRLRITSRYNEVSLSNAVQAESKKPVVESRIWPNPAIDKLNVQIYTEVDNAAHYMIQDINGAIAKQGEMRLKKGTSSTSLGIDNLTAGIYQLTISQTKVDQPISLLFVKQ